MKNNGNNFKKGEYYLGLDVGTNSVGWAVTDKEYNILKFKGNAMLGVRLFEEAQGADKRRGHRSARRRLERRKARLLLLKELFSDEIKKTDPQFFRRLEESVLNFDDKSVKNKKLLFNDESYNDFDYHTEYPTIYHLRSELIHSKEPHDVRLVFLALHHILKNRGHFLFELDANSTGKTVGESLDEFNLFLSGEFGQELEVTDKAEFVNVLESDCFGITQKKKMLRGMLKKSDEQDAEVNVFAIADMLAGATVKFSDLFFDDSLKNADVKSFCLKNDIDDVFDDLCSILGEKIEVILNAKTVFDAARLTRVLDGESFISDAKIKLYEKNKNSLRRLKEYVKEHCPDKYKTIFVTKKEKLNNYTAYSTNKLRSLDYKCTQEEFCNFLKSELAEMKDNDTYKDMYTEIENKEFMPRLTGTDNGIIPCQLHLKELERILENASGYLEFLNSVDTEGVSVVQKVVSIFSFRVPYYVGPLNEKSPHSWVVRTNEKIYPWNFEKVVDKKKSAEKFIVNLIGKCSYTGDYVLPKDSLLYSEYMLRNEINLLRINGKELPRDVMNELYNDLFVVECKKVTRKGIKNYLLSKGLVSDTDEISGIDEIVKSRLKSYHDFKPFLESGLLSKDEVEEIIQQILVFGDDKKMFRECLCEKFVRISKDDADYICRLKYKDWGRLSRQFLTEIYHTDECGNSLCIMDMLKLYNVNLSHLMSSEYQFRVEAETVRNENVGSDGSLQKQIDDLYLSPSVKRSVRQTLKIIDEVTDIEKAAPAKIFIEVARGTTENLKGKRTISRKDRLVELYKACGEDRSALFGKLCNEEEGRLRNDKLYLYYTQFGKCMYSGENIDFDAMIRDAKTYDIDHIFPRSRIKDDSIDNRVLVKSELNRDKTNVYPIDAAIREKRYSFWKMLKERGLISDKKFTRLVRQTPLTEKELSEFVARQLVETQQSTKAIISLIKDYYPNTTPVFSKAVNVSEFRQKYELPKCRDINDLHHAKDAYLNIVVGNVYNTKFTERFFKNISFENYSLNKVFEYDTPTAWNANGTSMGTVRKYMRKNNISVTRMPREAKGQLFDLTLKPAGKGQMQIKKNMSIEKYGGYNNVSGAYFFLVEHTKNKKRIRSIESVMICDKEMYEKAPYEYCTERLNLCEPRIIVPVIRMDSLLELDGARVYITGRTGDRILYKHAYELVVDIEHENYIKKLEKYVSRCAAAKKELSVTEYDGISQAENGEMYEWFVEKLKCGVYQRFFKNMIDDLEKNRDVFDKMPQLSQSKLLLEILKAFKCDRQMPNFSELNGKASVGMILYNKKISSLKSAYLVSQSPTGMFEYKTDLLK